MNSMEIEQYIGYPEMTIVEAMQKIDVTGGGILFIVDELKKLIGTLTDGDIRRWLIKTGDLKISVLEVMQKHPCFLIESDREQAKQEMIKRQMRAMPIVNEEQEIIDIQFNTYNVYENTYKLSTALRDVPVVIMAGGKGTRLLPYTNVLPKPLIPIGSKPIIERIIDQFCEFGCNKFYLILNYKKNMIKAYFNEIEHDDKIEFIEEEIPLGTGGGLSLLKKMIKGTFFLSNCDVLIKDDFSKMLKFHKQSKNKISMICSVKNFKIPYGVVHTGSNGMIEAIEEKPTMSFYTNTGCYVVDSEILEDIPDYTYADFPQIIDNYRKKGYKVGAYPIKESAWLDMGQMDEFEKMRRNFEGD